jgi:hypothetical protein
MQFQVIFNQFPHGEEFEEKIATKENTAQMVGRILGLWG